GRQWLRGQRGRALDRARRLVAEGGAATVPGVAVGGRREGRAARPGAQRGLDVGRIVAGENRAHGAPGAATPRSRSSSAKWQAATWPGSISRSAGASTRQR